VKQWQFSNSQWLNQGQDGVAHSNAWQLVVQSAHRWICSDHPQHQGATGDVHEWEMAVKL